jgi:putative membrane protein
LSQLHPDRDQPLWSVVLRGIAMGAADIVPGVSGGTIAFITGIYFRLLQAISGVPEAVAGHLIKGHFSAFWRACDGTFLLCLLAGILASVVTLASAISFALSEYPILIWSFFFGLIVASVWHVSGQIQLLRLSLVAPFVAGAVFAWWVTTLTSVPLQPSGLMFFGAGALAICAMILPGISGSFILVILGMYAPVLEAIRTPEPAILAIFATGCLVGLLSVARVITWAFSRFHDSVLAVLIGFMVGSLNKVWPWKQTLSWRTNSSGEQVPVNEASVSPFSYADLTGQDPQILMAGVFAAVGFLLVIGVEWAGKRRDI